MRPKTCHTNTSRCPKVSYHRTVLADIIWDSSVRAISRYTRYFYNNIRKVFRNIMNYFPYKIHHAKHLLDTEKPQRLSSVVCFLNRMSIDLSWPWNIMWSDEVRAQHWVAHAIAAFELRKIGGG